MGGRLSLRHEDGNLESHWLIHRCEISIGPNGGGIEGAEGAVWAVSEGLHDHLSCESLGPAVGVHDREGTVIDGDAHGAERLSIVKTQEAIFWVDERLDDLQLLASGVMGYSYTPLLCAAVACEQLERGQWAGVDRDPIGHLLTDTAQKLFLHRVALGTVKACCRLPIYHTGGFDSMA
jgi:hypothetical protein